MDTKAGASMREGACSSSSRFPAGTPRARLFAYSLTTGQAQTLPELPLLVSLIANLESSPLQSGFRSFGHAALRYAELFSEKKVMFQPRVRQAKCCLVVTGK